MKPLLFTLPAVFAAGGGILALASVRRKQAPPRNKLGSMGTSSLVNKSDTYINNADSSSSLSNLPHATPRWMSTAVKALSFLLILILTAVVASMVGNEASALSLFAVTALAAVAIKLSSSTPIASAETMRQQQLPSSILLNDPSSFSSSSGPAACKTKPSPLLQGTWIRDTHRSESMSPVMDTMQLNGLVRMAVKLVRGCEIKLLPPPSSINSNNMVTEGEFQLDVFSAIKWFKVRERYQLDGRIGRFKRRDLRGGKHEGRVEVLEDGALRLHLKWDEPHGGVGTDTFRLVSDDEMHVMSELRKEGSNTKISYNTIYRRKR